jgi:hypothetical protein
VNREKDLSRWQGLEIHYPFWDLSSGKSAAKEALDALQKFIFPDRVPAVVLKPSNSQKISSRYGPLYWLRNMSCMHECSYTLELATPECQNHYEVTGYDKAADVYAYIAAKVASIKDEKPIEVYKRTCELFFPVTRGCHESYHSSKTFDNMRPILLPFFAIRPIFSGSGGYIEIGRVAKFVLSPRTFIPAGPTKSIQIYVERAYESFSTTGYRIHFYIGESLKNEWTRFINNGLTSYIISVAEEGIVKNIPQVKDPIKNMQEISKNSEGEWKVELENEKSEDAISFFNSYYLDAIERLFEDRIINDWDKLTLDKTKYIVDKLGSGNVEDCKKYLQWVEVKHFIENPEKYVEVELSEEEIREYTSIFGKEWEKIQLSYMFTEILGNKVTDLFIEKEEERDLHEIISEQLFEEDKLLSEKEIGKRVISPPPGRARLREQIIKNFSKKYTIEMYWDQWGIIDRLPEESWEIKKVDWSEEEIRSYIKEKRKELNYIIRYENKRARKTQRKGKN